MKKYLIGATIIALMTGCSTKTTIVTEGDKDGLLNDQGNVQVKPVYKKLQRLENISKNDYEHPSYVNLHWLHINDTKYAVVKNVDNKYGIIDHQGNLKLKAVYDSIGKFFNGYAKIEVDKKFGLINDKFEVVVKPIYDDVRNVIDGAIIVQNYQKNNKLQFGCLNSKDMSMAAPLDYDMIYLSNEERMRIEKGGQWGFMATDCSIVVQPQYKFVNDFSNGFAKVQREDGLWTYVNLDGKEIERKTFQKGLDF